MLLRRFTKHLSDQNWFAVWLDITIVVVGIFLGMQVTEWNEDRKENLKEYEYIERFIVDIGVHIKLMDNKLLKLNVIYEDALLALDYLEGKNTENISSGRLVSAFYNSTSVFPYYVYNVTYDELLSSGKIHIISSVKKREALSIFYKDASRLDVIWNIEINNRYRNSVRSLISPGVQTAVLIACESLQSNSNTVLLKECDIEYDSKKLDIILTAFLKQQKLQDLLRLNLSRTKIAMGALKGNTQEAMKLLEILKN